MNEYIEDEDEKQEEKVSAFEPEETPTVSESKIIKTENLEILQKKEKPPLAPTNTEFIEVKATEKRPPEFEISDTQSITAEAQAVETKESSTEPQEKKDEGVGTELPELEIKKTEPVIAKAKKVEKRDIETETETKAPTLSISEKEVSFGYPTKSLAKPLSFQNDNSIFLTGEKSFGELQKDVVAESMHIPAKPRPTLEIDKPREKLLIEAQPKPESEISSVETFDILRQSKPENEIKSEVLVEVLPNPKAKPAYVKTKNGSLFIKGEKPSKDLIIDLDLDEEIIDLDLDEDFESEKGKLLQKRQHDAMVDIVRTRIRSCMSDKDAESVVSKIFEGKDEETKEVKEKLEKIEGKLWHGDNKNDKRLIQKVHEIIAQYISGLNNTPIDAVEKTPKAAEVSKMFKPGWSVPTIQSKIVDDTIGKKFFSNLSPSKEQKVCFIGKSAVTADKSALTTDAEVQADGSRIFEYLEPEYVMQQSFVDDKLSYVSQLEQKERENKELEFNYSELQKAALNMLNINKEYSLENENLKSIEKDLNKELVEVKKEHENLKKEFEKWKELEETGCDNVSAEEKIKEALKGAKEIAAEAMDKITSRSLSGEKAEELLKRFGVLASRFSDGKGQGHSQRECKNNVCQRREKFMNSLAHLLQKMTRNPKADAFNPISTAQWTLKGGISKVSKPFEVTYANSFKIDIDSKVEREKEAQQKRLADLMGKNNELIRKNEELESKLREKLDNAERKKQDVLGKENEDLRQKLEELKGENKKLEERLKLKEEEVDYLYGEFVATACKELEDKKKVLEKDIKEKDEIIAQKNEENRQLKLRKLIREPGEEGDDKKEEEEAERKMNDLMRQLESTEDVKLLKQGIALLLDYAQKRLSSTASKFGLKDTENSGEQAEGIYNDFKSILQKNTADSFVHTVSSVQENIMAVWKRMILVLKPKALSEKHLEKAMADAEEEKINSEAEKRKQAVVEEKDKEIAALKKKLEEMRIGHNMKVLELENKLRRAGVAVVKRHVRNIKTDADLSIYKHTDVSGMWKEKSRNENLFETPVARDRSRDMIRNASYSRSDQRSYSQSRTFLETFTNSYSNIKYGESQIKGEEEFWKGGDWQQQMSFKRKCGNSNSLGSIPEMWNDTNESTLSEWPELKKMCRQLLERLDAYLSKKKNINKLEWEMDLTKQISDWNQQGKKLFSDTEKISQMSVVKRQSIKKETGHLVTPKVIKKTKTVTNLRDKTGKKSKDNESNVDKNLLQNFNSEESDVKNNNINNNKNNRFKNSNKKQQTKTQIKYK